MNRSLEIIVVVLGTWHLLPGVDVKANETEPWGIVASMPQNVVGTAVVSQNGFLYAFEDSFSCLPDCIGSYFAELAADGTIGPWIATENRTMGRAGFAAASNDNHVYLAGGATGHFAGSDTAYVEYAPILADGSLGTWRPTSPLGRAREDLGFVVSGDHIYALGGTIASTGFGAGRMTEFAPINPDGSLGTWEDGPDLDVEHPTTVAVVVDDWIYVIGGGVHGYQTAAVERSEIQTNNGSLGPWESDQPLPGFRSGMGATTYGGTIFVGGGHSGTFGTGLTTEVFAATVQDDHSLSQWSELKESLNEERRRTVLASHEHRLLATGALADDSASGIEQAYVASSAIPAVSEWGLAVMTLLVLCVGRIVLMRPRDTLHVE